MKATLPMALAFTAAACHGAEAPPTVPEPPSNPSSQSAMPPLPPSPAMLSRLAYPVTRKVDAKDSFHGVDVPDPYRWLEDGKSPEVGEWMKGEDALARAELSKLPERDAIAARLKELFYLDSVSAPKHRGARYFYTRRHAAKEKSIVYFKQGKGGAERVLLDPNGWSTDGSLSLGNWQPSWDGKTVAYTVRKNASDEATLHVLDVGTGKQSTVDVIEGARYAEASWTPKGDGFYYTWLPTDPAIAEPERPGYAELRFHKLGEDPKKDRVVHEKTGNPSIFLTGDVSHDGRWLIVSIYHGWTSSDVYFRDLKKPVTKGQEKEFTPLSVGKSAHYGVTAYKDQLYVLTDEGAPRYRLFRVDPTRPARADWKEIVPERADATLDGCAVVGGRLALNYMKNATGMAEIRELDGTLVRNVALPGVGSVSSLLGRDDEDEAYFAFESYTVPSEIHQTSVKTGKTTLHSRVKVPVDPAPYEVEQVFYPSKDGTRVSMFVVRRKDLKKDGSARALLYGYGGFQVSHTPAFMASIYPWLERGGVFVVANLRGGGEYGEDWHRAGMLLKKQNVFDDFVGAAEHLVREKYTDPSRLVIYGASNGGLLVGAAITQRPDLFAAAVCGVPLLDMVRYHLSGAGKTWISEYGSSDDKAQFAALHAYSPYHRVTAATKYPAVLLLSADSDDRVDPMHARKFAAALQAATSGGPVLLRIERNSGHGGADLVKAEVEKGADRIAFSLAQTGSAPANASK